MENQKSSQAKDLQKMEEYGWFRKRVQFIRYLPLDLMLFIAKAIVVPILGMVAVGLWIAGAPLVVIIALPFFLLICLWAWIVIHALPLRSRNSSLCPPELKQGFLRRSWTVVNELFLLMLLYSIIQAFNRLLMPLMEKRTPKKKLKKETEADVHYPVLLIHGFLCNSSYWLGTRIYLGFKGVENISTVTLSPPLGDIVDFSNSVKDKVDQVLQETGAEKVIIVGHSMGGVIARYCIQNLGMASKVAKVVALGTPHHGTRITTGNTASILHYLTSTCVRQLQPESPLLTALLENEWTGNGVPITNIFSYDDEVILPQESSILDVKHAKSIPYNGVAHLSLAFSPTINRMVFEECSKI